MRHLLPLHEARLLLRLETLPEGRQSRLLLRLNTTKARFESSE